MLYYNIVLFTSFCIIKELVNLITVRERDRDGFLLAEAYIIKLISPAVAEVIAFLTEIFWYIICEFCSVFVPFYKWNVCEKDDLINN